MKLTKDEFINKYCSIREMTSVSGARYTNVSIDRTEGICKGIRESSNESFKINIHKLYEAYDKEPIIKTTTLKLYTPGVQSPAYALLRAIGVI